MTTRIFNFSAGPAILPEPVLRQAQHDMLSLNGTGMSVMEVSHRSEYFRPIIESAERGIRGLLAVPDDYRVLFLQGGATLQFSMVPMNFLAGGCSADYILTGAWGEKAAAEARSFGCVRIAASTAEAGYRTVPQLDDIDLDPSARYIHYTSNETIEGIEFSNDLDAHGLSVVCDASSNILSKPIDIKKYSLIYAGAQKNIGPSGVTVVIISDEMLARVPDGLPALLDYRKIAENGSMLNTPNTWGIYIIDLVCKWLAETGGLEEARARNIKKAGIIYDAIDRSDGYYSGHADRNARSLMNATFRLPTPDLEREFCAEAAAAGMVGLAGHRSVGGIRASVYNAFPVEGAECLAAFMDEFSSR